MDDRNLWIYCRVDGKGASAEDALRHQVDRLMTFGKEHFFSNIHVCADLASAHSDIRPGMRALLDAINVGDADVILVSELGRLYRNFVDLLQFLSKLQEADVLLLSIQDGYIDNGSVCGEFQSLIQSMKF